MMVELITDRCPPCGSMEIIKNGQDYKSGQKYPCKTCKAYGTLQSKRAAAQAQRSPVLDAYFERASMRGIERIFRISRSYLAAWLLERLAHLPHLWASLVKWQPGDVLQVDEIWSFVLKKGQKRWLWLGLCRRSRQMVAYVIGDRSHETCRQLWERLPDEYKACTSYSDFGEADQKVFPKELHHGVGKERGETAHLQRWNNTVRQRLGRFVRKTLSFSKSDLFHEATVQLFMHRYNLQCMRLISQF